MAKLYIVSFEGKTKCYTAKIDNNETVKKNLSYGGEATFRMYGDHGAVMDTHFSVVATWSGRGVKPTAYGKAQYGL